MEHDNVARVVKCFGDCEQRVENILLEIFYYLTAESIETLDLQTLFFDSTSFYVQRTVEEPLIGQFQISSCIPSSPPVRNLEIMCYCART